ncbi:MAG: hypothetical protein NVS4B3_01680 [Gemmatimonadaceae bacterium]
MSDAVIFTLVFAGLFVARIIAATIVFCLILPRGDRCPNCDAVTVRLEASRWTVLLTRWFRSSWCYECGWEGMLRRGPLSAAPASIAEPAKNR